MKKKVHLPARYLAVAALLIAFVIPFNSLAQRPRHTKVVVVKKVRHPHKVKKIVRHAPRTPFIKFVHHNRAYRIYDGKYYMRHGNQFVKVRPEIGMRIPYLPNGYKVIAHRRSVFFKYRGVYYKEHRRGGFVVVNPPMARRR